MFAKLIRGQTYYLGDKLFTSGKKVEITDAEKDLLMNEETGAYDVVTVEGEATLKAKFEISDAGDEPEAKPVRSRTKPAA